MVEVSGVEKPWFEMSRNLLESRHFNPGLLNPRLFNHELINSIGVEKFLVEKSGVEKSGVEVWNVLSPCG